LGDRYFQRLWIVQDILLARVIRVLVKDVWISWHTICAAADKHRIILERLMVALDTLSLLPLAESPASRPRTLESYLAEFAVNACADHRDKIHGFMGLVDEQHQLVIDYAKSIEQVFVDVVMVCINSFLSHKSVSNHYPTHSREYGRAPRDLAVALSLTGMNGSLSLFLLTIWMPHTLGRFQGLPSPITAMGFSTPRWWVKFLGQRRYVEDFLRLLSPLPCDWHVGQLELGPGTPMKDQPYD
jgi:hypothetical protein